MFILNADFNFSRDYFDISYSLGSCFECATGNNGTNVSKMKFIIFTNDYSGLPLGLRLQEKGHIVLMALIEPEFAEEKYEPPKDKKDKEKEQKAIEYLKLNGTGLIKREWAKNDININEEIKYWSKVLNLPLIQFARPYIKKTSGKRINHKGSFGHGTGNLRISSVLLAEKIFMSLKAIFDQYNKNFKSARSSVG